MFKKNKFNFKHNFDLENVNRSRNTQYSKFIVFKIFFSVIGNEDFYNMHYLLIELKIYLSFANKKNLDIRCGSGRFLIIYTLIEKSRYCVDLDPTEGRGGDKKKDKNFRDNINDRFRYNYSSDLWSS